MKPMPGTTAVCLSLVAALSLGCLRKAAAPPPHSEAAPARADSPKALGYVADRKLAGGAEASGEKPQPAAGSALAAMTASLKLIRTGQALVEVPSYRRAEQALQRLALSLGGYVADSKAERDDEGHEHGTLILRIPAERFAEAISGMAALGTVRSQNVSAQDVTKAYTDLETRLRVKRDTALRLREILKTHTAKLSDVLEAEQALARVVEEIEQAEGERRFYDQQVALSTLSVELREPRALVKSGALLFEALGSAAEVLANSVAAMVYLAAGAAPWAFVLWILWRLARARRAKRTPPPAPPAA
jgi:hypothetical protein